MHYEKLIGPYAFSDNKSKLQLNVIHHYLSKESYWAQHIPLDIVKKSIEGSLCFAVYLNDEQIGFARVITDQASFAYLADVFILPGHRGKGLSKELMRFIMACPRLQNLRRFVLATRDAHSLYEQFGFTALAKPSTFMEIKAFESYPV